jgi:SAM-dependent methyltransferase
VGAVPLGYSDGRDNEQYLHRVFDNSRDLSSGSTELETWIKDWPTEYHLSRKRAQLLKGFDYDLAASVLEVGCGCGAITRFLGETFKQVISVEGSPHRAALARKRCRELDSVSIITAPFQTIRFHRKFDIVFCIGVFEYSMHFVEGDDPYAQIIEYFADYLTDNGVLVLAIENQYGLKYFASASEDHTKARYDGIEGYHRFSDKAKTFGYRQLKDYLLNRFKTVEYFFPFPDYKVPDGVLAEALFDHIDAAPLLASFKSRDYLRPYTPKFDERLSWEGLVANRQVPFFANSFIVVAGKSDSQELVRMKDLAILYNRKRAEPFHTLTRIYLADSEHVIVDKKPLSGGKLGDGRFEIRPYTEDWRHGQTVHMEVRARALNKSARFVDIFQPALSWYEAVRSRANGGQLDGEMVDAIWQNSLIVDGQAHYIDLEWFSAQPVPLNTLIIRAVYWFLVDLRSYPMLAAILRWKTTARIITDVAAQCGVELSRADFQSFEEFETELHSTALGRAQDRSKRHIKFVLRLPQQIIKYLQWGEHRLSALRFYLAKVIRLAKRLYHERGLR